MIPVRRWRVIGLIIFATSIFFFTGALTQRDQSWVAVVCMGTCCAMVPLSMSLTAYIVYQKMIKLPE